MVEVLSSAKIQSVKEIKKRAKIKAQRKLLLKWALIIVIIIILFYLINSFIIDDKYSFEDRDSGITFYSQDFPVKDSFSIIANDKNLILSFNIHPEDINGLGLFTDQIVYLQSIFSAKKISTILVINIMDSERKTISCQSNLGDVYVNEELTKEECDKLLHSDITVFAIDYPDVNLEESKVQVSVSDKYIFVSSKNKQELDKSILLIASYMFSDLLDIQKSIDDIKNKVNDQNKIV